MRRTYAHEMGFKVVGISDIDGGIYNAEWPGYCGCADDVAKDNGTLE